MSRKNGQAPVVDALLRSPFPWRQIRGLRLVLEASERELSTLSLVFPLLTSRWPSVRELAYRICESYGDEGADLMMVCATGSGKNVAALRLRLDQMGYGVSSATKILADGSPVAKRYVCRRLVELGPKNPQLLTAAYIDQALRFLPQTLASPFASARARSSEDGMDAELYASLLTAVSDGSLVIAKALTSYLRDERPDVRRAVYKAWSTGPAVGKRLLVERALGEADPNLQLVIADNLLALGPELRAKLADSLGVSSADSPIGLERRQAAQNIALMVIARSPSGYGAQLEVLAGMLSDSRDETRNSVAEALVAIIEEFAAQKRGLGVAAVSKRRGSPTLSSVIESRRYRAYSQSLASLCKQADRWADAMFGLLTSENQRVRSAAILVLELVLLSTDQSRRVEISEAIGFAALGEADEKNKRTLDELLRRLEGNRGGDSGMLGFQIAA